MRCLQNDRCKNRRRHQKLNYSRWFRHD